MTRQYHNRAILNAQLELKELQRDHHALNVLHDSLKTKHANLEVDHKKLQEYVEKVNKGQMKSILNEKSK